MKKKLLLLPVLLLCVMVVPTVDAGAGLGNPHQIILEKVLVGGGDPDTEFEIAGVCVTADGGSDELEFISANEGGLIQLGNQAQTCTLSEVDTQGAVATFECSDTEGDAVCLAGNVVQFTQSGVPEGEGSATITITNTFGVTPTSDTTPTTEDPGSSTTAAAAAAAATRPSFTG